MKFRHPKYTFERPFMSDRHMWQLVGPDGGIDFTVNITEGYGTICGLEFHHAPSTGYRCDEAPDHINCWLIGGPCRHDGTSMYAAATLWPRIEPMLRSGDHETIWRFLEGECDRHFADFSPRPQQPEDNGGNR